MCVEAGAVAFPTAVALILPATANGPALSGFEVAIGASGVPESLKFFKQDNENQSRLFLATVSSSAPRQ